LLKICLLKRTDRQLVDWFALFWGVLFALFCLPVAAASVQPKVVVIIDDIGHRFSDRRALDLPREVTFSILPDAPMTTEMSELAHAQGRDIMLHMPMESFDGQEMGPDGLRVGMFETQMELQFARAMESVPYARIHRLLLPDNVAIVAYGANAETDDRFLFPIPQTSIELRIYGLNAEPVDTLEPLEGKRIAIKRSFPLGGYADALQQEKYRTIEAEKITIVWGRWVSCWLFVRL